MTAIVAPIPGQCLEMHKGMSKSAIRTGDVELAGTELESSNGSVLRRVIRATNETILCACCHGPADILHEIVVDPELAWVRYATTYGTLPMAYPTIQLISDCGCQFSRSKRSQSVLQRLSGLSLLSTLPH